MVWSLRTLLIFACCSHLIAQEKGVKFGFEFKGHYRDSDQQKFPVPFPFPDFFLPPGETRGSLETVESGTHFEVSRITLFLEGQFGKFYSGRLKLDGIDRYDRNPTSTDNELDVDEVWLQYGVDDLPETMPDGANLYFRFGKFGKFERQDDRNLESYGLVSTRFNRFEDAGLEMGVNLGQNFYLKMSYTTGNPVFMRDTNALAGDNGTPILDPFENPFPDPELKSGFVVFYDAEIEDWKFDSEAEAGLALGWRVGDQTGYGIFNFMAFGYKRDLRTTVDLTGTFYGGDLDLLLGVEEELGLAGGLPLTHREKQEYGANLWVYWGDFTFFGQYVDSDIAGLESSGYEGEGAYTFSMPWVLGLWGKPFLATMTPAIRYSELDSEFAGNALAFPTPSVWWQWKKLDYGLNIGLTPESKITVEYTSNEFLRLGQWQHIDEMLATFSVKWMSK